MLRRPLLWAFVASLWIAGAGPCPAAAARANPKRYWPGGVVPVVIDPSIAHPGRVRQALEAWEAAGIRFPNRTGQPDYVVFTLSPHARKGGAGGDEVEPEREEMAGASSKVGRTGGRQTIEASGDDVPWWRWAHEIGHALGLYHEQLRNDRDRWVTIHWDNIRPSARHNFEIKTGKTADVGPFDVASIMLYKWNMNAVDASRPTITWNADPSFREFGAPVLQKLSRGDVAAVRHLYFEGGIQELGHRRKR